MTEIVFEQINRERDNESNQNGLDSWLESGPNIGTFFRSSIN